MLPHDVKDVWSLPVLKRVPPEVSKGHMGGDSFLCLVQASEQEDIVLRRLLVRREVVHRGARSELHYEAHCH